MAYETIAIRKLTPAIGAEVSGVDLASLSNRQASELHDALMAHQVLFFRDQQMSVDQHKAFGRLFGELLVHPAARAEVEGHPEIRVVHADEKTKTATGEVWHSDMSCEPEPPMGSILYLHQSPPVGGDTAFANMYLAYEMLSEPIRRLVQGLSAFHTSAHVYSRPEFGRSERGMPFELGASHGRVELGLKGSDFGHGAIHDAALQLSLSNAAVFLKLKMRIQPAAHGICAKAQRLR